MIIENYRQALRYAMSKNWYIARDIVHNAYLIWHNKHKRDLFDEPLSTIIATVKWAMLSENRHTKFMWRGEFYPIVMIAIADGTYHEPYRAEPRVIHVPKSNPNYEEMIDTLEKSKLLNRRINQRQQHILNRLNQGYSQLEIAKEENSSAQDVFYHIKQIRQQAKAVGIHGRKHQRSHPHLGIEAES